MGNCCEEPKREAQNESAASHALCPRCGATGRVVGDAPIQALLIPGQAGSLLFVERRFCKTPTCDVLYYGADGRFVGKTAAVVRVGLKETADPIPLCYCFDFARADVRREVAATGACSIPAQITAEVRAGRCACETRNPSGVCCLGEVNKAVKEAMSAPRDLLSPAAEELL